MLSNSIFFRLEVSLLSYWILILRGENLFSNIDDVGYISLLLCKQIHCNEDIRKSAKTWEFCVINKVQNRFTLPICKMGLAESKLCVVWIGINKVLCVIMKILHRWFFMTFLTNQHFFFWEQKLKKNKSINIYPVSMMLHLKIQQFQRNFKQVALAWQNFSRKVLSLI